MNNDAITGSTARTLPERRHLPEPSDVVLSGLGGLGVSHLELYGYLHGRRENPPTMNEIREFDLALTSTSGSGARTQIDRRVRDLYVYFEIRKIPIKGKRGPGYQLVAWEESPKSSKNVRISKAVRARVLSPQRCAMCGREPLVHGVELEVDHKLPQSWGGLNDEDNLQPLCTECNAGKKDWFSSYEVFASQIETATQFPEPHRRIGELLKAFDGELVPGDLISVVASMGAFQEDWQKRLRELRELGWRVGHKNVRLSFGTRRVRSHYFLEHAESWPLTSIHEALKEAKIRRDEAKAALATRRE